MLLAIAAGNRRPIVPNMSFEYVDSEIHEDLHKIIKYSCGEVCNSSDQLDKVMRIWTTFLEPILGVQTRTHGSDDPDLVKAKSRTTKSGLASIGESNAGAGSVAKHGNGDESEQGPSSQARLANGAATDTQNGIHDADRAVRRGEEPSNTGLNGRLHSTVSAADEIPSISAQNMAFTERSTENLAAVRIEQQKANLEFTPGLFFNILCPL